MRSILAGFLILFLTSVAMAQVQGTVVTAGIGGYYRPNCWVPLKISLSSLNSTAQTYRIQVIQEDLDRDKVYFSRPITLNASTSGRSTTEQLWVYFLPNSSAIDDAQNISADLGQAIQVILCDENGKPLQKIPFGAGTRLVNLDNETSARYVVGIGDSTSQTNLSVFNNAVGLMELITSQNISHNDLPTNPLGFQCVDNIIWSHSDPGAVSQDLLDAISLWVKNGGKLIVSQPADWQKVRDSALAPLLPVDLIGIEDDLGARTLSFLGNVPDSNRLNEPGYSWSKDFSENAAGDPWRDIRTQNFSIVQGTPRLGAKVDFRSETRSQTPFLVRWMWGAGSVTWVAQDLSNPSLKSRLNTRNYGWLNIWTSVLGIKNNPYMSEEEAKVFPATIQEKARLAKEKFSQGYGYNHGDVGKVNVPLTEIRGRAAALVSLAILFFLGYWVLAALGSHFLLAARKRLQHSWLAFGVCAVIATGITGLFVKLVLRGPPELAYVSIVKNASGQSHVSTNLGLLVKQDGVLNLNIPTPGVDNLSTITPIPIHPRHFRSDVDFVGFRDYDVSVPEISSKGLPNVKAPFRGTLKKFQVNWTENSLLISGNVALSGRSLSGVLTNKTGHDFQNVYFAYTPQFTTNNDDFLVNLLPAKGSTISWPKEFAIDLNRTLQNNVSVGNNADGTESCRIGFFNGNWMRTDFDSQLSNTNEGSIANKHVDFIAASLFDRIWTPEKVKNVIGSTNGYRLTRWATRNNDVSHAVAAGSLVILAIAADTQDNASFPTPFLVDGKKVSGSGTIYYQFVIPLTRPSDDKVESSL